MLTPKQLVELRKAAIAATPGPWIKNAGTKAPAVRAVTEASKIAKWIRICVAAHTREGDTPQNLRAEANTDFIARANPYVVLQLLDKISAQQARITDLELALFAENQKRQEVERQRGQLLSALELVLCDTEEAEHMTGRELTENARAVIAAVRGETLCTPTSPS